MTTGAKRQAKLKKEREAEGRIRLQGWLSKEASEKLGNLCSQTSKTRLEVLEELLSRA